jgi:hypothetical protein
MLAVGTCVFLAYFLAWGPGSGLAVNGQNSQTVGVPEPVVVELFTSEGCSSCPPADAFLAQLDAGKTLGAAEIIALEEHVDYWDQQGWKDPFSSSTWTARQSEYSGSLHSGSPYTPEMIVDGTAGFVGSRVAMARLEIQKAAENKKATFKVSVEKPLSLTPKDTPEVILAITESGLHSSVKAGENAGQELRHSPVLRELKVIGVVGKNGQDSFTAQSTVKLDSKWNLQNLRAIAFVQEKKSRRILGAATVRLTQ